MHKWMRTVTTDFARFWTGRTISSFGSAFTSFALPLLVYDLTRSALGLALAGVASFLPWPLFGLLMGAWVDRVDRKRLMILADVLRAAALASIPALAATRMLSIWWIYVVAFVTATLSVGFTLAQIAAVPSLVGRDDLVAANGRIQASYSAAAIAGPALAGVLATWLAIPALLYFDALSFLVSAGSLALIRQSFNGTQPKPKSAHPPGHCRWLALCVPSARRTSSCRAGCSRQFSHPHDPGAARAICGPTLPGQCHSTQLVLCCRAGWRPHLLPHRRPREPAIYLQSYRAGVEFPVWGCYPAVGNGTLVLDGFAALPLERGSADPL